MGATAFLQALTDAVAELKWDINRMNGVPTRVIEGI